MIHGIGTDIVSVARIRANLERFGDRFAERILTDDELGEFRIAHSPEHFVARRFAAKEAAAKALGTGFRHGLALRHIGVGHDGAGRPLLCLSGPASDLCRRLGVGQGYVSLSDEAEYAIAFVTFLKSG